MKVRNPDGSSGFSYYPDPNYAFLAYFGTTNIPEPSALALIGLGAVGWLWFSRRRFTFASFTAKTAACSTMLPFGNP